MAVATESQPLPVLITSVQKYTRKMSRPAKGGDEPGPAEDQEEETKVHLIYMPRRAAGHTE